MFALLRLYCVQRDLCGRCEAQMQVCQPFNFGGVFQCVVLQNSRSQAHSCGIPEHDEVVICNQVYKVPRRELPA